MNDLACQYSIIRFLPYAETGEFANVGVVLACPEIGFLDAELMPIQRTKRITDFFDALDARIYREAIKYLRTELNQTREFVASLGATRYQDTAASFFELIRPREALLRFGPARTILASSPDLMLRKLFSHFVERDFATKEYHEEVLNKGVANILARASLKSYFDAEVVGDDTVSVRFPFVNRGQNGPTLAIKPLHLAKDEPSKIIDHGGHWVDRIRRLKKHQLIPQGVLFAIESPTEGRQLRAANEIIDDLRQLGTLVTDFNDEDAILSFANMARLE